MASFPDAPANGLLVSAGGIGEIVKVGIQTKANLPIYVMEFGERLAVGCLEEEITLL